MYKYSVNQSINQSNYTHEKLTLTKPQSNPLLAQTVQSEPAGFSQVLLGDGLFRVEDCAEGVEGEEADVAEGELEGCHGGDEAMGAVALIELFDERSSSSHFSKCLMC